MKRRYIEYYTSARVTFGRLSMRRTNCMRHCARMPRTRFMPSVHQRLANLAILGLSQVSRAPARSHCGGLHHQNGLHPVR